MTILHTTRLLDMKTNVFRSLSFLVVLASSAAALQDKLVVEAGRIVTLAGDDIENGVIVIENGRIKAVGKAGEVQKPWDATVIGGSELVAFPGFVEAHTSNGMDRANENLDVAPFLDIRDSIDPVAFYFEDCLRYGVTTVNVQHGPNCVVGGQGMIVRPTGMTVEEMVVRPRYGTKISVSPKQGKSRATQMQQLRETLDGLRVYLEELIEAERDKRGYAEREALAQGRELTSEEKKGRSMEGKAWKVDGLELIPRGAIDEKQAPLLEMVEGRRMVFLNCEEAMDVEHAIEFARTNGFLEKSVLVLDVRCWRAADAIAEAGLPVVLEGGLLEMRRNPRTGEEEETFVPAILADKGIRFALSSEASGQRSLWYQAALSIGEGLDRSIALASVTTTAAEILGLEKEVGSLEVGKMGNVVLFSGDPLSITSWVERVVIEGREVYDRRKDVRNKHLLEGTQPRGTAAVAEAPVQEDDHAEEEGEEAKEEEAKDDESEDGE